MKILHKITLGIAGTALLAALTLATYIFLEVLEEPLRLIDEELVHVGDAILAQGVNQPSRPWQLDKEALPHPPDGYWIKVYNAHQELLYRSLITDFVDLPPRAGKHRRYNVELVVPSSLINLDQDDADQVLFRVRLLQGTINGESVTMRIAKPIEPLEEELLKVVKEAAIGVLVFTMLLLILSYYLANWIIKPVVTMTALAKKISEDSLDQRIPLGKNKDELSTLAKAFNRMLNGLEYSFTRQKAFISNGSHELKSPLTRLLLSQEEILRNPSLPPEIREDLDRQLVTMQWMKKLIHNLLTLSRLEQQDTLSFAEIDLAQLLTGIIENYQEMVSSTAIELSVDLEDDLIIQGDRLHLQRLFINLIDNGIRYNDPEHGKLTITARKTTGSCIIDIDNAGQQIAPAEHGLIFEQFYRVEQSRSAVHGGVGLGLTMCKKIVDHHGGRILVQNGLLGGTQMRVILPC